MGSDPVHGTAQALPRVWAVADSDSYLKWAASTLAALPPEWATRVLVLQGTATPSPAQQVAATAGTSLSPGAPVTLDELRLAVDAQRPDILLVATRGATAQTLRELVLPRLAYRPAVVTGLPGVSVPATQLALDYRCFADAFIVHAKREVEEFSALASDGPLEGRIVLARLPFVSGGEGPPTAAADVKARPNIVFAVQAGVPKPRPDREELARILDRAAVAMPDATLVVKVRAMPGEVQTHAESHPLPEVIEDLARRGQIGPAPNLVVEAGPMAQHLTRARGLATVSSTAAIESLAVGVPVLILDDFGVSGELINDVFRGSGLLGDGAALARGDFRMPDPDWAVRHYFHPAEDNDAVATMAVLAEQARTGALRALPDVAPSRRPPMRRRYARFSAFDGRTGRAADAGWAVWFRARRYVIATGRRAKRVLARMGIRL